MDRQRVCDGIVQALESFGVRYFFAVSGANIEPIHDAIYQLGDGKLRSVLAKHESGAAFMADCHARVHGTLGVCGSTSGGGMLNLLAGVAEANAESVPLLALVGQPATASWGKGAFQDSSGIGRALSAVELFRQVTKYTALVEDPGAALGQLDEAIEVSLEGRPGATVLLLPRDILLSELPYGCESRAIDPRGGLGEVAFDRVRTLASMLREAKRPTLIIGHGACRSPRRDRIVAFAERYGIPAVVTLSGKGAFPNRHPLFRGVLGASGHPGAVQAIEEADVVVLVGASLNMMTRTVLGDLLEAKQVAYVNVDEDYVDRILTTRLKVLGDAGDVFSRLLETDCGPMDVPGRPPELNDMAPAFIPVDFGKTGERAV